MQTTIVTGASSGIARAVISQLLAGGEHVIAISRQAMADEEGQAQAGITWLQSDYSEQSIAEIYHRISADNPIIKQVLMFHGLLHGDDLFPEKQLRELGRSSLSAVFDANAIVPMLWFQGLAPLLKRQKHDVVLSVCSARVGSISDNQLGGWYSYRASKAALNMLLKTAAIESKRVMPNVKLLAFHPGTTDTPLSEPFQARVPEGKLFTPAFVAECLLKVVSGLAPDGELSYLDWDGKPIPW